MLNGKKIELIILFIAQSTFPTLAWLEQLQTNYYLHSDQILAGPTSESFSVSSVLDLLILLLHQATTVTLLSYFKVNILLKKLQTIFLLIKVYVWFPCS